MAKLEKVIWIASLLLLLLLSIFIRIFKIGQVPSAFYADEAAIAYNAYSLQQSAMDEYGKEWPLLFRSFGEYKTPTYSYMLIPVFKLLGTSVGTSRSLTVLSGLLTLIGVYFLTKLYFKKSRIALISTLVLATLPWHLIYSRTIYEVNLAFLFIVWALVFLNIETKKHKWNWAIAFSLLALSIVTYNASRIIVPLIGLLWLIQNFKELIKKQNLYYFVLALFAAILTMFPIWKVLFTSGFWERSSINIFSTGHPWGYEGPFGLLYYHLREWASLYISYLNPYYLFSLGDPGGRSRYTDLALIFTWQLPFLFLGLKQLESESKKHASFLIAVLFISPLAASLTRDPLSSIRSLFTVLPLSILIGLGISSFTEKYKTLAKLLVLSLFALSLGRLYLSIFKMNDHFYFRDWDYGLQELSQEIKKLPSDESILFVGPQINYIQLAFFNADPKTYQKDNYTNNTPSYYQTADWPKERIINNIQVRDIFWKEDVYKQQLIVFGQLGLDDQQIKEHCLSIIFEIKNPDNKRSFIGVRTNPEQKLNSGLSGCL